MDAAQRVVVLVVVVAVILVILVAVILVAVMNVAAEHAQSTYELRLEWGAEGVAALGPGADALVIVDVLSFSTAVDVAVTRGAWVYPYRWRDERAVAFAAERAAYLAARRGHGRLSLSPGSLQALAPGDALVLPSPNGATLTLAAAAHGRVYVGCLRNAEAVARALADASTIAVIPAGERWPSGALRPALEDWLGAGAIVASVLAARGPRASCSPEARSAASAFEAARPRLRETLLGCASGRELVTLGWREDVTAAAALNESRSAPRLEDARIGPGA